MHLHVGDEWHVQQTKAVVPLVQDDERLAHTR